MVAALATSSANWDYREAFSRHRGLLSDQEQQRLQSARVAIAGLGGAGGVHLVTLARLGVGQFHLADPDCFELANFNRQYGGVMSALGRPKVNVMADHARDINPDVALREFDAISADNIGDFLAGCDMVVDGIDFFCLETRRLLFREARRRGVWAITAAPLGFSAAWLLFDPAGMSFDDYFDLRDEQDFLHQLAGFAVGLAPQATHVPYLDWNAVDLRNERGPSAGLACQLCAGVTAAEILKVLLGRQPVRAAPHYFQFDPYRHLLRRGRLPGGNRHPWQRLKRWWLTRKARRLFATEKQP